MTKPHLLRSLQNAEQDLRDAAEAYLRRPDLDMKSNSSAPHDALPRYMLRFFLPLWASAGILDWYWHKRTDIENTAGWKESVLHISMFGEAGLPLLMGLFLEINAGVLASMATAIVIHELTAFVDVRYALTQREVTNWEQHTHSLLEVLPFAAFSMSVIVHWRQFRALLGAGPDKPDFRLRLKSRKVPRPYLLEVAAIIVGAVMVPYANELWRCWKARKR